LANLLATQQVNSGDMLCIDWDKSVGLLVFWKEKVASRTTVLQPVPLQAAAKATGGRATEITSAAKARGAGNNE